MSFAQRRSRASIEQELGWEECSAGKEGLSREGLMRVGKGRGGKKGKVSWRANKQISMSKSFDD